MRVGDLRVVGFDRRSSGHRVDAARLGEQIRARMIIFEGTQP